MTRGEEKHIPSFNFASYVKDALAQCLLGLFAVLVTFAMLSILGIGFQGCLIVCLFLAICGSAILIVGYMRRRRFYRVLTDALSTCERSYYLPEMLDEPSFLDGRIAFEALERIGMLSGSEDAERRQELEGYRDYIELWIHEVKTPVAAAKLILMRMHGQDADKLSLEIERIESQVEQALYYSRTASLSNDYVLKEMPLSKAIKAACRKNMRYLVEHGVNLDIAVGDVSVIADDAWLQFILGQIIVNAAKYGATTIAFTSSEQDAGTSREHTVLSIEDDGCGIPASDIAKVFDRGFVGNNGRSGSNATGMGLYLVASLAKRMNLGVSVMSSEGKGTKIMIAFPHDRRRKNFNLNDRTD